LERGSRWDQRRADAYVELAAVYAESDVAPVAAKTRDKLALRLRRAHRVAHMVASDSTARSAIDALTSEALRRLGVPTTGVASNTPAYLGFLEATDRELAGRRRRIGGNRIS
jgi:hypothetical protein